MFSMFTNVIKATFHVDRPRFGGGVDKRVFVHLRDKNVIGKFTSHRDQCKIYEDRGMLYCFIACDLNK